VKVSANNKTNQPKNKMSSSSFCWADYVGMLVATSGANGVLYV